MCFCIWQNRNTDLSVNRSVSAAIGQSFNRIRVFPIRFHRISLRPLVARLWVHLVATAADDDPLERPPEAPVQRAVQEEVAGEVQGRQRRADQPQRDVHHRAKRQTVADELHHGAGHHGDEKQNDDSDQHERDPRLLRLEPSVKELVLVVGTWPSATPLVRAEVGAEDDVEGEEDSHGQELEADGVKPAVDEERPAPPIIRDLDTSVVSDADLPEGGQVLQRRDDTDRNHDDQGRARPSGAQPGHGQGRGADDDAALDGEDHRGDDARLEEDVSDGDVHVGHVRGGEIGRDWTHRTPDCADGQDEEQPQRVVHSQALQVHEGHPLELALHQHHEGEDVSDDAENAYGRDDHEVACDCNAVW